MSRNHQVVLFGTKLVHFSPFQTWFKTSQPQERSITFLGHSNDICSFVFTSTNSKNLRSRNFCSEQFCFDYFSQQSYYLFPSPPICLVPFANFTFFEIFYSTVSFDIQFGEFFFNKILGVQVSYSGSALIIEKFEKLTFSLSMTAECTPLRKAIIPEVPKSEDKPFRFFTYCMAPNCRVMTELSLVWLVLSSIFDSFI